MAELTGRVALVTGGAMGIGREICFELARDGAAVVVVDRSDPAETAAAIIQNGGQALSVAADVTSEEDMARATAAAVETFGGVDILVNNAGIFASLQPKPFTEIDLTEWRAVMDVNVLGGVIAARAVVGSMRERGGGRIVNIASTTAFKGVAFLLHYTSSKGAVLAMTKALAKELGADDILVNAVAPGFTVSSGVEENAGHVNRMRDNAPTSRSVQREMVPGDIVGAVKFLAGPGSAFITGQTIVVDGGAYFH
jgi:NAD(P)-dependent dehydrogenase (short-subunit alcohol dehydrogenase family)